MRRVLKFLWQWSGIIGLIAVNVFCIVNGLWWHLLFTNLTMVALLVALAVLGIKRLVRRKPTLNDEQRAVLDEGAERSYSPPK